MSMTDVRSCSAWSSGQVLGIMNAVGTSYAPVTPRLMHERYSVDAGLHPAVRPIAQIHTARPLRL
eukprot:2982341-Prymnesium_polylepis.2